MLARIFSPRASVVFLVALFIAAIVVTTSRIHNSPHLSTVLGKGQHEQPSEMLSPEEREELARKACNKELELLRSPGLGLTEKIMYTRRCIRPIRRHIDRNVVSNITGPLITNTTILNLAADCAAAEPLPCEPLSLRVPPAYPHQQYRHLMFSMASSYERIKDSLPVIAHWLAGTGAQLVAVVADANAHTHTSSSSGSGSSNSDLKDLENEYRKRGILATIIPPNLKHPLPRKGEGQPKRDGSGSSSGPAPVEQLHFLLLRDMLALATSETRWLGVLDDDTFFPALYPLDQSLRRHDHTRPAYLGALSDNFASIATWGIMAYGGAGVFVSVPLARGLEPFLEECIRTTTVPSGDGLLRDCIYTRTTTKLTLLPDLHQHDIMGDPSGVFESGRHTLSIHHWKSWYRAPVAAMAGITIICGDCFLMRWRFHEDDALLVNGYSVSVYHGTGGLGVVDLERVEATFAGAEAGDGDGDGGGKYGFVYGPFRKRLGEGEKKSYRLVAVGGGPRAGGGGGGNGDGRFRQVYVHRASREGMGEAMDEVIELVWEG